MNEIKFTKHAIAELEKCYSVCPTTLRGTKGFLIATEKALDSEAEPAAWLELDRVRLRALLGAALPAWIAALAVLAGLEAIPLVLLALSSIVLHSLYRIPRQLG